MDWLEAAAGLENPDAMQLLGRLAQGRGDANDATSWFEAAAQNGNAEAVADLTAMANDGGNAEAMWILAGIAEDADDTSTARAWLEKAQALGHPEAAERLEWLDADGR
jgi:TPR repeat protein